MSPGSVLVDYGLMVEVGSVCFDFPFDVRCIYSTAFLWQKCYRSTRVKAAFPIDELPHLTLDEFDLCRRGSD